MNTFSLNIITVQHPDGTYISSCPQMIDTEVSAETKEGSIEGYKRLFPSFVLDNRNKMIQYLTKEGIEFDITSIPCTLNGDAAIIAPSDNTIDVERKIEILHLYQRAGYPQAEGSLTRPCELQYLESIKDADLDKEKLRLEQKIRPENGKISGKVVITTYQPSSQEIDLQPIRDLFLKPKLG